MGIEKPEVSILRDIAFDPINPKKDLIPGCAAIVRKGEEEPAYIRFKQVVPMGGNRLKLIEDEASMGAEASHIVEIPDELITADLFLSTL